MTTDHEHLEGTALGHLQRGMETTVRVPIWTVQDDREGKIDEAALLQHLQDLALVSPDVREVYVEPDGDGAWNLVDVDTEDTVAWFTLPMGAGF